MSFPATGAAAAAMEDCTEAFVEQLPPFEPQGGWEKTNNEWVSVLNGFLFSPVSVPVYNDHICAPAYKDSCSMLSFEEPVSSNHHMGLLTSNLMVLWNDSFPGSRSSIWRNWQSFNKRAVNSLLSIAGRSRSGFHYRCTQTPEPTVSLTFKRPDFSATVENVLMLIGEAKPSEEDQDEVIEDLVDNLSWKTLAWYRLPFLLAFTTAGRYLRMHVLLPPAAGSGSDKPVRYQLGKEFDMRNPAKRLQVAAVGLKIFQVMLGLQLRVPKYPIPLFQPRVNPIDERQSVELQGRHVIKITQALAPKGVYELLGLGKKKSRLPHSVHVVAKEASGYPDLHTLTIEPVCDPTRPKPNTEEELKSAIRAVLEALAGLHKARFCHRDVRWANILKASTGDWLLADFEHAAESGVDMEGSDMNPKLLPPQNVRSKKSGTLVACGKYDESGDIYRVGALVTELPKITLSPEARKFAEALMNEKKPIVDAEQALSMPWLADSVGTSAAGGAGARGSRSSSSSSSSSVVGYKRGRDGEAAGSGAGGPAAAASRKPRVEEKEDENEHKKKR
jgi:Protein kinase domain